MLGAWGWIWLLFRIWVLAGGGNSDDLTVVDKDTIESGDAGQGTRWRLSVRLPTGEVGRFLVPRYVWKRTEVGDEAKIAWRSRHRKDKPAAVYHRGVRILLLPALVAIPWTTLAIWGLFWT